MPVTKITEHTFRTWARRSDDYCSLSAGSRCRPETLIGCPAQENCYFSSECADYTDKMDFGTKSTAGWGNLWGSWPNNSKFQCSSTNYGRSRASSGSLRRCKGRATPELRPVNCTPRPRAQTLCTGEVDCIAGTNFGWKWRPWLMNWSIARICCYFRSNWTSKYQNQWFERLFACYRWLWGHLCPRNYNCNSESSLRTYQPQFSAKMCYKTDLYLGRRCRTKVQSNWPYLCSVSGWTRNWWCWPGCPVDRILGWFGTSKSSQWAFLAQIMRTFIGRIKKVLDFYQILT